MNVVPKIAYITNLFPSSVEWYVVDEIRELRRRGADVIPCSAQRVKLNDRPLEVGELAHETLCLQVLRWTLVLQTFWMCVSRFSVLRDLVVRVLLRGTEPPSRRARALVHTWLGAYYAVLLRDHDIEHIHVHHGYFSSWIAMVAARFLGVPFSMTLHGSDLLVHASYMDTKLKECKFCCTISEFNRRHILAHYPRVEPHKVIVRRMGVSLSDFMRSTSKTSKEPPTLLAVGRLHPVKNHIFLLQACYLLREVGLQFRCVIAGEGAERRKLEFLIRELKLADVVSLVGHVPHDEIRSYYQLADLVVLTSLSEGIPLVLMEAMAHGKIVLAPAITGIPELVIDGKTGFLYKPESLEDFVWQVLQINHALDSLGAVRRRAREHVQEHFNAQVNLENFTDFLLQNIGSHDRSCVDEDFVLQQI